jgi:hypothetical protein
MEEAIAYLNACGEGWVRHLARTMSTDGGSRAMAGTLVRDPAAVAGGVGELKPACVLGGARGEGGWRAGAGRVQGSAWQLQGERELGPRCRCLPAPPRRPARWTPPRCCCRRCWRRSSRTARRCAGASLGWVWRLGIHMPLCRHLRRHLRPTMPSRPVRARARKRPHPPPPPWCGRPGRARVAELGLPGAAAQVGLSGALEELGPRGGATATREVASAARQVQQMLRQQLSIERQADARCAPASAWGPGGLGAWGPGGQHPPRRSGPAVPAPPPPSCTVPLLNGALVLLRRGLLRRGPGSCPPSPPRPCPSLPSLCTSALHWQR